MNATSSISSGTDPADIIAFWQEAGPARWFKADAAFDHDITERFGTAHLQASRGDLAAWEGDATATLALLVLTDQFPRNIWRGSAHAFATDAMARGVADRAIARGFDRRTDPVMRQFFYLPFQHHEDSHSQAHAVALYEQYVADSGDPGTLRYAHLHADIITRFGRFPHRNGVMGRISTPEEIAWLAQGGFKG